MNSGSDIFTSTYQIKPQDLRDMFHGLQIEVEADEKEKTRDRTKKHKMKKRKRDRSGGGGGGGGGGGEPVVVAGMSEAHSQESDIDDMDLFEPARSKSVPISGIQIGTDDTDSIDDIKFVGTVTAINFRAFPEFKVTKFDVTTNKYPKNNESIFTEGVNFNFVVVSDKNPRTIIQTVKDELNAVCIHKTTTFAVSVVRPRDLPHITINKRWAPHNFPNSVSLVVNTEDAELGPPEYEYETRGFAGMFFRHRPGYSGSDVAKMIISMFWENFDISLTEPGSFSSKFRVTVRCPTGFVFYPRMFRAAGCIPNLTDVDEHSIYIIQHSEDKARPTYQLDAAEFSKLPKVVRVINLEPGEECSMMDAYTAMWKAREAVLHNSNRMRNKLDNLMFSMRFTDAIYKKASRLSDLIGTKMLESVELDPKTIPPPPELKRSKACVFSTYDERDRRRKAKQYYKNIVKNILRADGIESGIVAVSSSGEYTVCKDLAELAIFQNKIEEEQGYGSVYVQVLHEKMN